MGQFKKVLLSILLKIYFFISVSSNGTGVFIYSSLAFNDLCDAIITLSQASYDRVNHVRTWQRIVFRFFFLYNWSEESDFFFYLSQCVCALIIWNGSSNFHNAARNLSRSPSEFRSDDHSLPYMVISCLFPRLPASHRLCCQPVGASPTDLPAAVIAPADLLADSPPPPYQTTTTTTPSCAQTAGREREREEFDSGCLRLYASSHQQA